MKTPVDLDCGFVDFINHVWCEGWPRAEATRALAALADHLQSFGPHGSDTLPRSRRALQGWAKLEPQTTRPPLPWEMAALIALRLFEQGHELAGLAVMLMFASYARPCGVFTL